MARTFQDGDLQIWEAFANTGEHGFPDAATIVFRCRTASDYQPRVFVTDGDLSEVEARMQALTTDELQTMLEEALPLN